MLAPRGLDPRVAPLLAMTGPDCGWAVRTRHGRKDSGEAPRGKVDAPDDSGGLPAGAELHELRRLLAPSATPRQDFTTADYYRRIGRALEAGKFHLGFFDDRLAMPDLFGGDHAHTVANGIRCVKMDPITILTVMGMATERLGLGSTCSTTYYEPFHVARVFADAGPDDRRSRRLEHRHVDERRRGAEHGSRRAWRARPALRPRRRIPGGCRRTLGLLGR